MLKKLHYKDVILDNPKYSEITSRDSLNTGIALRGAFCDFNYNSPAIPANMAATIDFAMAEKLDSDGYFYILHRFYDYQEIIHWLLDGEVKTKSISVGVKKKDYELVRELKKLGIVPHFITIDIAHGHSLMMKNMISFIKENLPSTKIIAGNICTVSACYDLEDWGADIIKVGLSCGAGCHTYNVTGVGSPMFSTVLELSKATSLPIIADGGIKEVGDICKALVAGASMVMIGSQFARCFDSPAETVDSTGCRYKRFYGSASARNKGEDKYVEGEENLLLPMRKRRSGSSQWGYQDYKGYFKEIREGIASCMSYHGITNIKDMQKIKYSIHYGN